MTNYLKYVMLVLKDVWWLCLMLWLKWLLGVVVALFLYFGASQLMANVVTGTATTDVFAQETVPLILALVGIAIPVMVIGNR